jgi:hypothetical protein
MVKAINLDSKLTLSGFTISGTYKFLDKYHNTKYNEDVYLVECIDEGDTFEITLERGEDFVPFYGVRLK